MIIKLPLKYFADLNILGVAVVYYLSARLGYSLSFENTTSLPTWPPSGIAFALVILLGRSAWPGITIGALIANIMAYWNNPQLTPQTVITISSCIAIGSTLETLIGNHFVKTWIQDTYPLKNAKSDLRLLFVTMLICLIGAGIGN